MDNYYEIKDEDMAMSIVYQSLVGEAKIWINNLSVKCLNFFDQVEEAFFLKF